MPAPINYFSNVARVTSPATNGMVGRIDSKGRLEMIPSLAQTLSRKSIVAAAYWLFDKATCWAPKAAYGFCSCCW